MALVTVQRSPSPSNTPDSVGSDLGDGGLDSDSSPQRSKRSKSALKKLRRFLHTIRFVTSLRFSESYLAVKGAAIILPHSECMAKASKASHGGDIHCHLQSMFYLLRPQDTIQVAIKLESAYSGRNRYMAVVSTSGRQDTEESIILGIDCNERATIGLVVPIWGDTDIRLDGDGGFSVTSNEKHKIFKPVSVQAMWSALQSIIKVRDNAHVHNYHPRGLTHTWITYYEVNINSDPLGLGEWNVMDDLESHRPGSPLLDSYRDETDFEKKIKSRLKEIMVTVDLEEVTSKYLRLRLEEEMQQNLKEYRHFIDSETIIIMRQLDAPAKIFDYLYLGSEWNASNFDELTKNGVRYILNVTREIDNFFPGKFNYLNIRLYDNEKAELMKHWDKTYKFISKAKCSNSKVLVHCKMGISRSASTVIAYAMKEYGWSLDETYKYVKARRSCIHPNNGFMQQLMTYEGILAASKQRHNFIMKSAKTDSNTDLASGNTDDSFEMAGANFELDAPDDQRPSSWPQDDSMVELLKSKTLPAADPMGLHNLSPVLAGPDQEEQMSPIGMMGPFLFGYDSWDEIDISSRSADSMEDLYPEYPSPAMPDVTEPNQGPVTLLAYRSLDGGFSDGEEMLTEESDLEEDEANMHAKGFYDVCMLAGEKSVFFIPQVTQVQPISESCEGESEVMNEVRSSLPDVAHPDVKMEMVLAQLRRQKQLWRLQKNVKEKRSKPDQQAGSRLRADDSWIKGDAVEEENEDFVTSSPVATSEDGKQDSVEAEKVTQVEDVEVEAAVLGSEDADEGEQDETPPQGSRTEIGVRQHYQKEDIPWKSGMVKRQTKDLEHRIKGSRSSSKSSRSRNQSCSSEGTSSSQESCEQLTDVDLQDEVCGDDKQDKTTEKPEKEDEGDAEEGTARPLSIYDYEDIQLTPGLVRRTKQEIEARTRCASFEDLGGLTSKPVQRSSSLRNERTLKSKNRDSERRKTCLPIIRPSPSPESPSGEPTASLLGVPVDERRARSEEPLTAEGAELMAEGGANVKLMKIGMEDVPLREGLVRKQTRDFEEMKFEPDSKSSDEEEDTTTEPVATVTTPPAVTVAMETAETEEQEIDLGYTRLEEGVEIPCGMVKKQTMEIEVRYGGKETDEAGDREKRKSNGGAEKVTEDSQEANQAVKQEHKRRRVDKLENGSDGQNGGHTDQEGICSDMTNTNLSGTADKDLSDETSATSQGNRDYDTSNTSQGTSPSAFTKSPKAETSGNSTNTTSKEQVPEFKCKMSKATLHLIRETGKKCTSWYSDKDTEFKGGDIPKQGTHVGQIAQDTENTCGKVKVPMRMVVVEPKQGREDEKSDKGVKGQSDCKVTTQLDIKVQSVLSSSIPKDNEKHSKECHSELNDSGNGGSKTESSGVTTSRTADQTTGEVKMEEGDKLDKGDMGSEVMEEGEGHDEKKVKDLVVMFDSQQHTDVDIVDKSAAPTTPPRAKCVTSAMDISGSPSSSGSAERSGSSSPVICGPKRFSEGDMEAVSFYKEHKKSSSVGDVGAPAGMQRILISPEREPDPMTSPRKARKSQGKSHPLSKLTPEGRTKNPFYNTM